MRRLVLLYSAISILAFTSCIAGGGTDVIPGAERTDEYLPLIAGKRIALVANQTSIIKNKHLADSLLSLDVDLVRIFSPEHGFRGKSDAGMAVENGIDLKTGLPVISLYGRHKKPIPADLEDVEVVLFDIQDVGVRFYTYLSTMHYVMEACAENGKTMIILDRPNPNGDYIDGPVLETKFSSFVGMHPVPVVYGMTIGEYGRMINGEGWLEGGRRCDLTVIPCLHYDHRTHYTLPVPPSPNLPNQQAVRLYPSLAFFEGTPVSVGRGTSFPFQVYGWPGSTAGDFCFTPQSTPGAALHPKHEGQKCCGKDLRRYQPPDGRWVRLSLNWLIGAYDQFGDKASFFNGYFSKLAGTDQLQKQIESHLSAGEIRRSWEPGLTVFRKIRSKYLLYR